MTTTAKLFWALGFIFACWLAVATLFVAGAGAQNPCPRYVPKPNCVSRPVNGPTYRLEPITLRDYLYWAVNGGMPSPDRKPR